MTGYTKLFGSIVASTIWRESKETKIVWITMLALANKNGIVEASIPGLADLSRVSVEEARIAVDKLQSPDPDSRTKDFEGRRIEAVDGGWLVLNHAKYRAKMNADERREYFRLKQQEHRNKKTVKKVSTNVKVRQSSSTKSTQSESEAEAQSKEDSKSTSNSPPSNNHQAFIQGWIDNFREFHGMDYGFDGGRDGKAVKDLLSLHVLVPDLLEIAKMAWTKFKQDSKAWNCRQAATIHGFRDRFNDIRLEVKYAGANGERSNPRVENTCKPLHTPEEMWAIKQRKQEAARLAEQRAGAEDNLPKIAGNGGPTDALVPGDMGQP